MFFLTHLPVAVYPNYVRIFIEVQQSTVGEYFTQYSILALPERGLIHLPA